MGLGNASVSGQHGSAGQRGSCLTPPDIISALFCHRLAQRAADGLTRSQGHQVFIGTYPIALREGLGVTTKTGRKDLVPLQPPPSVTPFVAIKADLPLLSSLD